MDLCRDRWPPHSEHSPQSPQAFHWQSTQGVIGLQGSVSHGAMTVRLAEHGAPPFFGSRSTLRCFSFWPPPQSFVHADQSLQSESSQSCFGSVHADFTSSSGPGLQGAISFSESSLQGSPFPEAKTLTTRFLSRMPKQVQLQKDHSPQSDRLQFVSVTQGGRSLQAMYSSRRPLAGLPHEFGSRAISRRRRLNPLLHEAEQSDQSFHSPHLASTQGSEHGSVLQGTASLFTSGSHRSPPFRGADATTRFRFLTPPPQEDEQTDQSYQSLQAQSVTAHDTAASQGPISSRGAMQPWPPFSAISATCRLRVLEPFPHLALHSDHSPQAAIAQFPGGWMQGSMLHGFVSRRAFLGQAPPSLIGSSRNRVLYVWPPSHVLSQTPQLPHSASLQSSFGGATQPRVSFSTRGHSFPSSFCAASILRTR
mmetsp:Transcript_39103/g.110501  ORF Transcript_39103/g.110501 Transcript_39103/m.110501 type:complete len:422 (+) Transcript_39103:1884-3149(+)